MKGAMAIGTVLLLATAGACSKSYTLAPDAGPDRPSGTVTDAGDAALDRTSSDVQQTSDVFEAGGAPDGTSETRPDGPDTDETKGDAAPDATPEVASGDSSDARAESRDEDAPAEVSSEAGGDLSAEAGPDGDDAGDGVLVLSIPTIRDPAAANHPPAWSRVQTSGVVTAVKSAGPTHTFFLQAANVARYAGVYIY